LPRNKAGDQSSSAPSNTKESPNSSGSLSLSDIKAILSKLSESLRPSTQTSDTEQQREQ
jgi:hypothetical protein